MATVMRFVFGLILSMIFYTVFTRHLIHPSVKTWGAAINACWGKVREEYGSKLALRDRQVWGISSCKQEDGWLKVTYHLSAQELYLKPTQMPKLNVNAVRSSLHVGEAFRGRKINIWCKTEGRDQTEHAHGEEPTYPTPPSHKLCKNGAFK